MSSSSTSNIRPYQKKVSSVPLFSIVTVVYNAEANIEKTIQSLIFQDYTPIQYVVMDGASKDRTLEILERYREHIDILVSEPDKGIYDAMNKAISHCDGKYIYFLNAGDRFVDKHSLSKVAAALEGKSPDVAYGSILKTEFEVERILPPYPLTHFRRGIFPFSHQAVFLSSEIMTNRRFDTNYRIVADFVLFFELYREGATFLELPIPVARFLPGGVSANSNALHRETISYFFKSQHTTPLDKLRAILFLGLRPKLVALIPRRLFKHIKLRRKGNTVVSPDMDNDANAL